MSATGTVYYDEARNRRDSAWVYSFKCRSCNSRGIADYEDVKRERKGEEFIYYLRCHTCNTRANLDPAQTNLPVKMIDARHEQRLLRTNAL